MKKILSLLILSVFSFTAFTQVRISQIYVSGGNSTSSTYNRDFVEIFNAGSTVASVGGWSVQYASATGVFGSVLAIPTGVTLNPGQYYLLAGAPVVGNGAAFTADFSGTLAMSGTAGKVALINVNTATGTSSCTTPPSGAFQDVVGYGTTASCSEGTSPVVTTGIGVTTSFYRLTNGCTDTNVNSADFSVAAVTIRNSSTTPSPCSGGPSLGIAPNITGLTTTSGIASSEATFTISGNNLTPAAGNLIITPAGNIEVSLTSGSGFSSSPITYSYTTATFGPITLYTRISASAPMGSVNGTITLSGGGAAISPSITVTGSVVDAEPTVQATNIIFPATTNTSLTINWTNGNGAGRIVVVRATTSTEVAPADGTVYMATTSPSANTTGTGNWVVFNGAGTGPVTVTGLTPGTSYTVRVYEYNGTGGSQNYNTTTATGNPAVATTAGVFPNLVQSNFTGVVVPVNMAANTGRLPTMFYATVSGLQPNTAYRYFTLGTAATDIGTTSAAGLPILIDYNNGNTIYYVSSASLTGTTGSYGTFTTNASGAFSGSFGLTASGNAKFTAGNMVFPSISLGVDNGASTVIEYRYQLNQGITVLSYGATASPTEGTLLKGMSSATPKNLVAIWKSVDGSSFVAATARPLSMTITENAGVTGSGNYATALAAGYDYSAGAWNTIMPNNNPEGVRLIQQINLVTANVDGCSTDTDGLWPSGAETRNPTGGLTTPVLITATDAPLTGATCFSVVPVTLAAFDANRSGKAVKLTWTTSQEINTDNFEVLRSTDGTNWKTIAAVQATGNSNTPSSYAAFDNSPVNGKNFYRLRINDAGGRATLSDIRIITISDNIKISVSPNPVRNVININLSKKTEGVVQIALIDQAGAVVRTYTTGETSFRIDAASLSKGVYIVKIIGDDFIASEKIIVQ
ncbi:MAG: T9SS type A sorting domain-containing protein [Ferruginibacter sp.]